MKSGSNLNPGELFDLLQTSYKMYLIKSTKTISYNQYLNLVIIAGVRFLCEIMDGNVKIDDIILPGLIIVKCDQAINKF